jgi:hypothetical protein
VAVQAAAVAVQAPELAQVDQAQLVAIMVVHQILQITTAQVVVAQGEQVETLAQEQAA